MTLLLAARFPPVKRKSKNEHVEFQRAYFDQAVDLFRQPVPEEIQAKTRLISHEPLRSTRERILDVGTGTGVLIAHFLEQGISPELITGCDVSEGMLSSARERFPQVRFIQSDIDQLPLDLGPFDLVFFNGCFVNMYDRFATVERTTKLLAPEGRIVISHPLGRTFTTQLASQVPDLVAGPLPTREDLDDWCDRLSLAIDRFTDEPDFYLAILERADDSSGGL